MPLDGAGTEEEPRTDLWIRETVTGETSDLRLLGGELRAGFVDPSSRTLPGCQQLALGASAEGLHSHRHEQLPRGAKLLARVEASALAPQPLTVDQVRAGELRTQPGRAQPVDRFAVQLVGRRPGAQQRLA